MIIDPEKVAAVIAEIAEEEIASRFGKLAEAEIGTKSGPTDFVTEADRAAEKALIVALRDIYPGAAFIGEESAADDPAILDDLHNDGAFWIVDPLDGTRNFVQGRAEYGTIVALVESGEIRAGWIYAVPEQTMAVAEQGEGVFWDGERLPSVPSPDAPLAGYRAVGSFQDPWKSRVLPVVNETWKTEPARCSAYAYVNLARGIRDFAIYSRVHPWDHAAGALMLGELGGRSAYVDDNRDYRPQTSVGRPLLAAGNDGVWREVSKAVLAD